MSRTASTAEIVRRFRRWYAAAERGGQRLPDAMALATVDPTGKPSVRFVLLKGADERGFVFYTNFKSRKGRELGGDPRAALAIHWTATDRQVRIEGIVHPVSDAEADAYWESRPRASRLAALASSQSQPIAERGLLVARMSELVRLHRGKDVPRPKHWSGFRLDPETIEFWTHRDHRLHERELFTRGARGWRGQILQP